MSFPSTLSTFNYPTSTDRLSSPSHSALENSQSSAIGQLEAVIGTDASTLGTIIGDLRSASSSGGGHIQSANKGGTGQTSYTKGDLLVATSSSVLAKLAVSSTDGLPLVTDSTQSAGVKWGGFPAPTVRTYSSVVSIWYRPSTLSYLVVEVQGRGGSGAAGTDAGATGYGGGGGGAGGYSRKFIPFASLPLAASVLADGSTGLSYFGSIMSATGGGAASGATGGTGGIGSGGQLNVGGSDGASGGTQSASSSNGGSGGSAVLGGGGTGGFGANGNGVAGKAYGGGGGGGGGADSGTMGTGAAGADGIVIVYEY